MEDNYAKDLLILVKNASAWLLAEATHLLSRVPILNKTRLGFRISNMLDTISRALLTEEGSKYGLPLLLAIAYFIFPIDAIPDFIIPLGFMDDVAVLAGAARAAKGIIESAIKVE